MDAETRKQTVRKFFEVLDAGEADAALAFTTGNPDFLIFNNPFPGGTRGFCGLSKSVLSEGPHREYTAQFVDGETVLSQVTVRGTTMKGEVYENYYLIICTFKGDKIDHIQEYNDSAYAHAKFGLG